MKRLRIGLASVILVLSGCVHKTTPVAATPANSANPESAKPPEPALSWADCIKIQGSKIEQTYPEICVAPDGRKAAKPQ